MDCQTQAAHLGNVREATSPGRMPRGTLWPRHEMTANLLVLLLAAPLFAQDAAMAPAALPGKGLAQHDFFYAGEQKQVPKHGPQHTSMIREIALSASAILSA